MIAPSKCTVSAPMAPTRQRLLTIAPYRTPEILDVLPAPDADFFGIGRSGQTSRT
ncbi:hypothetical protein IE4872_PC00147 (plasmid) [Rhizobium gallicum]|uniref:Uncharacterized protein n=1 Tax=Rhizobium gallicum TaxID=56730 RepID=A0A1L5NQN3_9HYPH|nr:hypothetical protein IE4872_PC00147 [Rhizobium gallicum]